MEKFIEIFRMTELSAELRIGMINKLKLFTFEDQEIYGDLIDKLIAELIEALENQPIKPTEEEKFVIEYCLRHPATSGNQIRIDYTIENAYKLFTELKSSDHLGKPTIKKIKEEKVREKEELQQERSDIEKFLEDLIANVHFLEDNDYKESNKKATERIEEITKLLDKYN